jgi:hypothetical protein
METEQLPTWPAVDAGDFYAQRNRIAEKLERLILSELSDTERVAVRALASRLLFSCREIIGAEDTAIAVADGEDLVWRAICHNVGRRIFHELEGFTAPATPMQPFRYADPNSRLAGLLEDLYDISRR